MNHCTFCVVLGIRIRYFELNFKNLRDQAFDILVFQWSGLLLVSL